MAIEDALNPWTPEPRPALLTVRQAARVLNLGRSTVYELIAAGRLEVVHIGRSTRVPADAIARLIANLRSSKTDAAAHRMPERPRVYHRRSPPPSLHRRRRCGSPTDWKRRRLVGVGAGSGVWGRTANMSLCRSRPGVLSAS